MTGNGAPFSLHYVSKVLCLKIIGKYGQKDYDNKQLGRIVKSRECVLQVKMENIAKRANAMTAEPPVVARVWGREGRQ